MSDSKLDMAGIYGHLLTGSTLSIAFPSPKEAETFRIAFHRFRTRQSALLVSIGEPVDETFRFSFTVKYSEEADAFVATMKFTKTAATRAYTILTIEGPESEG